MELNGPGKLCVTVSRHNSYVLEQNVLEFLSFLLEFGVGHATVFDLLDRHFTLVVHCQLYKSKSTC